MSFRLFLLLTVLFTAILAGTGCNQSDTAIQPARDPAVFRINLDFMPRMLVFALSNELWAAYDVEFGRLYKTWKGGINFNGPMYDDRHNVQSSTKGITYSADTTRKSPWAIVANNNRTAVNVDYTGYTLKNNFATIHYRVRRPSSTDITIDETPGYRQNNNARVFTRTFKVSGLKAGEQLMLHDFIKGDKFLSADEENIIEISYAPVFLKEQTSEKNPVDSAKIAAEVDSTTTTNNLSGGKRLIELSDCAACHTLDNKAIGPSFKMIADKYNNSHDVVESLAKKIISGGTGVWGRQLMTPHPGVSAEDAANMVRYILSLTDSPATILETGLAANFFKPGIQLAKIPDFIPGQKPNLSVVVPDIEFVGVDMSINREKNDFFNFDDQFVMFLSGFINISESGKYQFKLKANAGAKFFLNGKKIADVNYVNYDYHDQEITAELNKGANRIRIEYYEDIYSSNLSLRWRKPGETKFIKIPEEVFTYDPSDIVPIAPGLKDVYEVNAPGFGSKVDGLHPSFDITTIRPEGFNKRLSDLEFLPDGSLAVSSWDSTGNIYIIENTSGNDRSKMKARLFATGLYEVMGLEYVDGKLYALQKWELTELNDSDGDGVADEYRAALGNWTASSNFHEWAFGLIYKDGFFYFNTGIGLGGNGIITDTGIRYNPTVQTKDRGKTLKVRKSDWSFEAVAHGYKAPNGIGIGVDQEIFTTDNEGHMVPTNKLMHVPRQGYPFFGNDEVLHQFHLPVPTMKQPVLWMPTAEVSNSPSQPVALNKGPYAEGQMVFGDVHYGGLHRVFVEKVNGEYQGAIFRFTQGLEAGINRLAWGPDGNLYMAGLGAGGDFGHNGQCCGLQRISYNGKITLDILSVNAKANGMEITFTEPLRAGDGLYTSDYSAQQYWYETADDVPEGGVKNDIENLTIRSVNVSPDRKKVFLEISGMKKEHVIYIEINRPFTSEAGHGLWTGEAWYTLNTIPLDKGVPGKILKKTNDYLHPEETAAGWKLLFNGQRRISGSKSFSLTEQDYKNFELECDWKIEPGTDGGIFYHLPSNISVAQLGLKYPEMQFVDEENNDSVNANPTHLTGAVFNKIAPRYKISKPHDINHFRLKVNNGRVEHWLNGIKVSEYDAGAINAAHLETGRIALVIQHGTVYFSNIRIREL